MSAMRQVAWTCVTWIWAAIVAWGPVPAGAQSDADSVWCLDEAIAHVRQTARWRCEGRIVTDAQAREIKRERVQRIRRALDQDASGSRVAKKRLRGTGSGFFITAQGHVLTNNHVIRRCKSVSVTPVGQSERAAVLVSADRARDLALLATDTAVAHPALLRADDVPREGEMTALVGYPLYGMVVIKPQMATGHVLADDLLRNPHVFAVKTEVRRGNSGGPVLDAAGRVIGVVFASVDTPKVYAKTGKLIRDVALAIRLKLVRRFLRPHGLGVRFTDSGETLSSGARFERAREFVVQVYCWR